MVRSFTSVRDLYNLRLLLQFEYEEWLERARLNEGFGDFPPTRNTPRRRTRGRGEQLYWYSPYALTQSESDLTELSKLVLHGETLMVRRIRYGSEGIKDLVGIGTIVGHLKEFVLELVKLCIDRQKRKHENEGRRLKNIQLKSDIARGYVELAERMGYKKVEIRRLIKLVRVRQRDLEELIDDGKITGVQLLDRNLEQSER